LEGMMEVDLEPLVEGAGTAACTEVVQFEATLYYLQTEQGQMPMQQKWMWWPL
jgi:hypothetical protein